MNTDTGSTLKATLLFLFLLMLGPCGQAQYTEWLCPDHPFRLDVQTPGPTAISYNGTTDTCDGVCSFDFIMVGAPLNLNFTPDSGVTYNITPTLAVPQVTSPYKINDTTFLVVDDTLWVATNELMPGEYTWFEKDPESITWTGLGVNTRFLVLPNPQANRYKVRRALTQFGLQLGTNYSCWTETSFSIAYPLNLGFTDISHAVKDTLVHVQWRHALGENGGPYTIEYSYTGYSWATWGTTDLNWFKGVLYRETLFRIRDKDNRVSKGILVTP
jgi:hypothetical protein